MAEATLAAEGSKKVERMEKSAPVTRKLEEAGRPEEVGGPEEVEEPGKVREVGELVPATRGPEEEGGPEEAGGPEKAKPAIKGTEELGRSGKLAPAARKLEEIGGLEEPRRLGEPATTLSSSCSDYWQALALAATLFRYCFSFLNCLVFFGGSLLSSSLLSLAVIASLISPSLPQSIPVHPSRSLPSESQSVSRPQRNEFNLGSQIKSKSQRAETEIQIQRRANK